jgi:hypothetical protein
MALKVRSPEDENACNIPMVAEELWRTKAMPAPARYPRKGLSPRDEKIFTIIPESLRVSTADVILRSPEKRTPNPMAMLPADLVLFFFENIMSMMPRISAMGARVDGWKKRNMLPTSVSALRSNSLMI